MPSTKNYHFVDLCMPSEKDFKEISHDYNLSKASVRQLRLSLAEALEYYEAFRREVRSKQPTAAVRRRAERASALLTKLAKMFEERDARSELLAFEAMPQLGALFSTSAVADFIGEDELEKEYRLLAADYPSLANIVNQASASQASRDRFYGIARQAIMQEQGSALLLHIFNQLRHPFDLWLHIAGQKKNGRPINAPREILLFHLFRDARLILAENYAEEALKGFCSYVTGCCNLDDTGFSDAFDEIERKYRLDFFWSQAPNLQPIHGDHLTGKAPNIEVSPAGQLLPAKPRSKK